MRKFLVSVRHAQLIDAGAGMGQLTGLSNGLQNLTSCVAASVTLLAALGIWLPRFGSPQEK